jgi:type II secretory pathway component GspD/PulD (secretin)
MAQNKNSITLNAERMTLAQLIRAVERQTDFLFVYDPNEIDIQSTVSAKVKNQTVQSVLDSILSAAGIKCIFKENNIILQRITSAKEAKHIMLGTVSDTNGEPIVGANVLEKGSKNGVFTDSDGKFQIEVSKDAVLTISSIGFSQMEVPTYGKEDVRIVLKIVYSHDIDPHSYDVDPLEEGRAFKEQSLFACKQAA